MKCTVDRDLCEDIKKGDEVEIIPEYSYMLGSSTRIKDYFALKPGEVVVKKIDTVGNKGNWSIIKCDRKCLKPVKAND